MHATTTMVTEGKRITGLVGVMMIAVSLSTATAIVILYQTAFEQQRAHLVQSVHDQAKLMEAAARLDGTENQGRPGEPRGHTLLPITTAFDHHPDVSQLAEIDVARREGDEIVYLVRHGRHDVRHPRAVRFTSALAEPMRRAVSGQYGSMIGLDYRGVKVLAAYESVPALDVGVVAKIDLADIRAPFVRAAATVIGLALVLVTAGAVLFRRLTSPLVRHLTQTERRYERIFHGIPVPIWELDFSQAWEGLHDLRCSGISDMPRYLAENPDTVRRLMSRVVVTDANAATLRQFGARSKGQFDDWFARDLVPSAIHCATQQLQAIVQGREALLSGTIVSTALDGRELSVVLAVMIPQAEHGYESIPVSALDVTSAVQLRRREEELALILASAGEGIFGMDTEGRCTFVNRAALEMLGYRDQSELLGREMHSQIHHTCRDGTDVPREACPIHRSCRESTAAFLDNELLWRRDGTCFSADYRSYPMVRDGVVVGTVVTFTDVTERKEREAQLVHAQKMDVVGQLTGAIAHDFNNLLTVILTNLRVLEDKLGPAGDAEITEILDDATSAGKDGAALTRRLLAFSRMQPLEPQWMDLDIFIDHTCRFLRRVTGDDIELVVQRTDGPLPVHVDRQQLENVLLNLTINARDAMPNGGRLTITTRRHHIASDDTSSHDGLSPGKYVVVSVADTGVGMSTEAVRRAVEPFYSTKPMGKGSGLGLSTALGFAQQSGGDLTISSTPGEGTAVSLFLPEAATSATDGRTDEMSREAPAARGTVLVVEDNVRVRRLARRCLSSLGYRVLEAENAAVAVQVLEREPEVDLLFTDLVMPGDMDGRALARWVLEHRPEVKVLLTTGFQDEARAAQADEAALPLLTKPYTKDQLQQAIRDVLGERWPSVTEPHPG